MAGNIIGQTKCADLKLKYIYVHSSLLNAAAECLKVGC